MLTLSHILAELGVAESKTIVMRHAPGKKALVAFKDIVRKRPDLLDAYQRLQTSRAEKAMIRADWLVSCSGEETGKAVFIGVYRIAGFQRVSLQEQFDLSDMQEFYRLAPSMEKWREKVEESVQRFDLRELEGAKAHSAQLVLKWPGKERSWYRLAHKNTFEILETKA